MRSAGHISNDMSCPCVLPPANDVAGDVFSCVCLSVEEEDPRTCACPPPSHHTGTPSGPDPGPPPTRQGCSPALAPHFPYHTGITPDMFELVKHGPRCTTAPPPVPDPDMYKISLPVRMYASVGIRLKCILVFCFFF